ncbi:hypothetical protein BLAT2472_60108 [Burkholderia latens]
MAEWESGRAPAADGMPAFGAKWDDVTRSAELPGHSAWRCRPAAAFGAVARTVADLTGPPTARSTRLR